MKKLISILLLWSFTASAGLPPTTLKGQSDTSASTTFNLQVPASQATRLGGTTALLETGNPNQLPDPGFEAATSLWTASGGATATTNSTAKGTGAKGYDWDSNAAAQTLVSTSVTVPEGLKGRPGAAYCEIKVPSGTATHTITVNNGTSDLVTATTIVSSANNFFRNPVYFTWPTSGTVKIKLASVASNEPEIYVDDCYLGLTYGQTDISNITAWTAWTPTFTGFGTPTSVNFESRRVGEELEFRGTFVNGTPTATEGRISLGYAGIDSNVTTSSTLPTLSRAGDWSDTGTSSATDFRHRIVLAEASKTYVTFGAEYSTAGGSLVKQNGNGMSGTGHTVSLKGSVKIQGWGTQTAVYIDTLNWRVDANISGANGSLGTPAQTSYVEVANGSWTLTNNAGNGVLTAMIPCTSTTSPTGTTCSGVNESLGVVFYAPAAGDVEACVSFGYSAYSNDTAFQIVETAPNAQTILQEGKSRVPSGGFSSSTSQATSQQICGTFTFSSPGQKALRLFYEKQSSTNAPVIYGDADGTVGQRDIHWTVKPISQQVPLPILMNQVSTNSTGQERVERVRVNDNCSASPCTIESQSGSWVSSITRGSTGNYTVNFTAGMFTAGPSCQCSPVKSATRLRCFSAVLPSTTSWSFETDNGTSDVDAGFMINCQGPK